jgi:hypothetical protein
VLPPSLHNSGNRYRWAPGRSIGDVDIPTLPPTICAAMQRPPASPPAVSPVPRPAGRVAVSPSTAEFLAGLYADGPQWNERLFRASCDLAARGLPLPDATLLLLQGARPHDLNEEAAALRTIESAFSQPRAPAIV